MTRTLEQDQAAIGRSQRIPEPPFRPTSDDVGARYKATLLSLPEKVWHMESIRSLALQVAECECLLNRAQMEQAELPLLDWEGKCSPLITIITKHQNLLGVLLSKLKALPSVESSGDALVDKVKSEQDVDGNLSGQGELLGLIANKSTTTEESPHVNH